ncbi:MAG: hypothetical protein JAZ11_02990 [Candidatus Thiodiazotropha lotti]|nr:hypothetical protein [Candidatus Thiodiazotropha lotti]
MDIEQKYKPYRRLIFAIVVRALLDLRSDSRAERESARQWLLEHGAAYLRAANISRPQSKIERLLGELKQGGK